MHHSVILRLLLGASVVAVTAVPMNAVQAASGQPMFSSAQGWRADVHERVLADGNGDGRAGDAGFGHAGTYVAHSSSPGGGSSAPELEIRDFGYARG